MDSNLSFQAWIQSRGEVPFSEYMEQALYGPDGYYTNRVVIGGSSADFYTAATRPLFGATLARYAQQVWASWGRPRRLQVVEFGAGQGELARSLIESLAVNPVDADVEILYTIVERSERLRAIQGSALREATIPVSWEPPRTDWPTVMIANELLDAFAVEWVERIRDDWQQAYVAAANDQSLRLYWRPAGPDLTDLANRWLPIADGNRAEVSTELDSWFIEASRYGQPIRALLFDYGMTLAEWEAGVRPQGTLRGYRNHEVCDPLSAPGHIDITADVHWDQAMHSARQAGWEVIRCISQGRFLLEAGIIEQLSEWTENASVQDQRRWTGQFKQLVLPGGMGERFSVLELSR